MRKGGDGHARRIMTTQSYEIQKTLEQRGFGSMKGFVDEAVAIGAGLWNWKLKCQKVSY